MISTGKIIGGGSFTRGQIYKILSNPIYVGEIHHAGKTYKGQHHAIIERELWSAVQCKLGENRQGEQRAATIRSPSLLAGKVFDHNGEPLVASHTCKGKVRYRYYVSRSLQHDGESAKDGWRIPAKELEGAVIERLASKLQQPHGLIEQMNIELFASNFRALSSKAEELASRIRRKRISSIRPLIERVQVSSDKLLVRLDAAELCSGLGIAAPQAAQAPELVIHASLKRSGRALQLVQTDGRSGMREVDTILLQLVQQARSWWDEIVSSRKTIAQFARDNDVTASYVTRIVRLAFLSPRIIEAITAGTQPVSITADRLRRLELPANWDDQHEMFGL